MAAPASINGQGVINIGGSSHATVVNSPEVESHSQLTAAPGTVLPSAYRTATDGSVYAQPSNQVPNTIKYEDLGTIV